MDFPPLLSPLQAFSDALVRCVSELTPTVVTIHAGSRLDPSGFVWRDGLVVTADEALAEEDDLVVTVDGGQRVPATLVGRDPATNVALLRVPDGTGVPLASTAQVARPGALAIGVGRGRTGPLVAMGILAEAGPAWRSREGGAIDEHLAFDLRLPSRAEGGLLAGAGGGVYGMAVFGPRRRLLAIPLSTIERTAQGLLDGTLRRRGYLGIAVQPVPLPNDGGRGAMVLSLDMDGPCAKAGVRQGDVITAIGGTKLERMRDLMACLASESVGGNAVLSILRAGEPQQILVTVGERPGDR